MFAAEKVFPTVVTVWVVWAAAAMAQLPAVRPSTARLHSLRCFIAETSPPIPPGDTSLHPDRVGLGSRNRPEWKAQALRWVVAETITGHPTAPAHEAPGEARPPLRYAPPVPLPDGPMLFWAAAAVMLLLVWWAGRDTGAS